ncbi:LuxR C-terminal-related transcriptional regulator [Streptomyces sp. AM 4-1-1]|uniref:LuxR C-terminal-related transcriptional regulator n=1 Tax=Streptomyces sp. AM 4-1-1 TaxID=3028710 RepID=UPI0023B8C8E5|nr:LuxR C-terminal-related transcriptional regulator [Streptomyces sp. AM 4-1-1]WEH34416.1 LuxR C-terminal-related transcriptional regulator [Streptomyces sp. AM 4-1-1]
MNTAVRTARAHATSATIPPHPEGVDEFAVHVYEYTLGHGSVTPEVLATELDAPAHRVEQALSTLRGLHLVKSAAGSGRELVAVHPEAAQLELLLPLESAIRDHRRRLAGVKGQLLSFMEVFDSTRQHRETVVVTDDRGEIALRLREAAQCCASEILLMQPCVTQEPAELINARPLINEALQRGVQGRVLYPHTARSDAAARSYALRLTAAGGQVRTSPDLHARFLVFDRKTSFVTVDDGTSDSSVVTIIYEPSVATFLGSIHDLAWQSAFPLQQGTNGYAGTLDDLRATIVGLLASGIKDEVIARRVGLSERSFRRHVAAIMQNLAARSRFQAGVMAAQTGLLAPVREGRAPLVPATTASGAA